MLRIRQLLWSSFVCSTLLAGAALAQSTLTQIRDTVKNADGTLFDGTVIITWNGFTGPSGGTTAPLSTSARVYNGALSVLLVPTTTASSGTYYQAVYNSSTGLLTWTEIWQVPPSTTPLTLSAIRTTAGSGSGGGGTGTGSTGGTSQYATLPIALNQVTGLSADLATINATLATLSTQISSLSGGGTASLAGVFVDAETPAGNEDGTNVSFSLAHLPSPANSLSLYRNGLFQTPGVDYNLSGTSITFLSGSTPKSTDVLAAYYRMSGTPTLTTFVDAEIPSGAENGTNLTFSLVAAPNPSTSLKLYKNGVLLNQNSDFTLSGNTISFANAAVTPAVGDLVTAAYRH